MDLAQQAYADLVGTLDARLHSEGVREAVGVTPAGEVYHGALASLRQEIEDALAFASTVIMLVDVTSAEYATKFSNTVNSAVRLIHWRAVGVDLEYRGRMGVLSSPLGADSSGSAASGGAGSFFLERDLSTARAPLVSSGRCAFCGDHEQNLHGGIAVLRQLLVPCPVCEALVCARCAIDSTIC